MLDKYVAGLGLGLRWGEGVPHGCGEVTAVPSTSSWQCHLILAAPVSCLRLGKAGFPNSGKPTACKQPPNPVLIPLLLGALVSGERRSGLWGQEQLQLLRNIPSRKGRPAQVSLGWLEGRLLGLLAACAGGWGLAGGELKCLGWDLGRRVPGTQFPVTVVWGHPLSIPAVLPQAGHLLLPRPAVGRPARSAGCSATGQDFREPG